MIIWLIGLAGSGKTTLANELFIKMKAFNRATCVVDGDLVRSAFDNDLGYSEQDRKINAKRIRAISKLLDDQGFDVIVPILSNYQQDRDWNRANYSKYFEIFIDTPMEVLLKRDQKQLYSNFKKGIVKNVIGCDIKFNEPKNPDLVVDGSRNLTENVQKIYDLCIIKNIYAFDKKDLRVDKKLYMYAKYHGKNFIDSYKTNRNLLLKRLEKDISLLFGIGNLLSANFDSFNINNQINIILREIFKENINNNNLSKFVFDICSIFEVKKRICLLRDSDNKFTNGEEVSFASYISISYIIAIFLDKNLKYNVLSTFLKLNDMISYIISSDNGINNLSSECKSLLFKSIEIEMKLINKLY